MKVKFEKYEGAGNDFIIIDNREARFAPSPELINMLCDRRFGIGADGFMLLEKDPAAEFRMRYFNADGPEATMCGNGGRCIALFAHNLGIGGKTLHFVASDGEHTAEIVAAEAHKGTISLRMGDVGNVATALDGSFVDTGSPHYVEFTDDVDSVDVQGKGRALRYDDAFAPAGTNVNFVQAIKDNYLKIRTYERGVEDETYACGTGVTAAAIVANAKLSGDVSEFSVEARGGMLGVKFTREGGSYKNIFLTGPARRVFSGEFDTENFDAK